MYTECNRKGFEDMIKDQNELEAKLNELVEISRTSGKIDMKLYTEYDVKRGLRDSNGKGVLTGLTEISDVVGFQVDEEGQKVPADGKLYYQGYSVMDLVRGFKNRRFGFEEVTYLLLFGELPRKAQLDEFLEILSSFRKLPDVFT